MCSKLRLLPAHYLVIKDVLVRESFRLGYLKKGMARQMVKIEVSKTNDLYDFFVIQCRRIVTECNFALGHIGQVACAQNHVLRA